MLQGIDLASFKNFYRCKNSRDEIFSDGPGAIMGPKIHPPWFTYRVAELFQTGLPSQQCTHWYSIGCVPD